MTPAATAESPHAAQVAENCRGAKAVPLEGLLATIPVEGKGIAWEGDSQIVRELLAARSAARESAAPAGQVTVVKSGPHRAVYRVELLSGTVFLKHFKIADWRSTGPQRAAGQPGPA